MISSSSILRRYMGQSGHFRHKQSYRQTKYRYLALFFACMIMLGDAYCFDNPMALQSQITEKFGINNFEFNLLYTVYSLPNIILPFFGGILIDKIGARLAILIFSTIIMVGQFICVLGAYFTIYWVMILGRVIFGIGSESLNTSQNSIMAQWFRNKEMSLAIGLCISVPKVGSAINSLISPMIYDQFQSLTIPLLTGMGFLVFSYICGICLIYMDRESDKREKQSKAILENFLRENEDILDTKKTITRKVEVCSITKNPYEEDQVNPRHGKPGPVISEDGTPELVPSQNPEGDRPHHQHHQHNVKEHAEPKEEINFKDIAKMSGTFWIVIIICMLTEALFVPFLDNGNDFFQERFGFTSSQAGLILMLPYLISALVTPFLGSFVDKIGYRGYLIILTTLIFLITHILLLFLTCDGLCYISALPLLGLGICFAFYASVVISSVPVVVKPSLIGTAFGLTAVFQNTALSLFPLITGMIFNQFSQNKGETDEFRGYQYQMYFFVGMSVFNMIIAIVLQFVDKQGARTLQKSTIKSVTEVDDNVPRIRARHLVRQQDQQ